MSKHNSGPWKITHTAINGYRVNDSTGWGVAVVLKDVNDKANARLIAAAPAMLEALKGVIRVADRATVEFDAARAAVSAAEGKE